MPNYGCPKYWDERYQKSGQDGTFDWLESYASLKGVLDQFLFDKEIRILVLGCGNAEFSEDLYDDGYKNIVNIDISSVVIDQMNKRNQEVRPHMTFLVGDVTDMSEFETSSFDLAIDKSTIDALLCGEDSFVQVARMLKETQRILKTNGVYFAISYGKPESRLFHFAHPFLHWEQREFVLYDADCETDKEKEEKSHYIYTCRKLEGADKVCELEYLTCMAQLVDDAEKQKLLEDEGPEDELSEDDEEHKEDEEEAADKSVKPPAANEESAEKSEERTSSVREEPPSVKEKQPVAKEDTEAAEKAQV